MKYPCGISLVLSTGASKLLENIQHSCDSEAYYLQFLFSFFSSKDVRMENIYYICIHG